HLVSPRRSHAVPRQAGHDLGQRQQRRSRPRDRWRPARRPGRLGYVDVDHGQHLGPTSMALMPAPDPNACRARPGSHQGSPTGVGSVSVVLVRNPKLEQASARTEAVVPAEVSRDLTALPKAEMHLHLVGAMRPTTLDDLATRARLTAPDPRAFTTFAEFE